MRIISRRSLTECWKAHPDCKTSLSIWEERISYSECKDHKELLMYFPDADYIPNKNFKHLTIFNIKGNQYRLAVDIFFNTGHVYMKWFGKHADYDFVDFKLMQNGGFTLC